MLLLLVGTAALALASRPVPGAARPWDTATVVADSARAASAAAPAAPSEAVTADSIVVEKGARRLTLFRNGVAVRSYMVALGRNPVGDKQHEGDNRTPEGIYRIDSRNPQSKYHLALHISYPDAAHLARAEEKGVRPGGNVMIHGLPRGFESYGAEHRKTDWTEGCIALTNREIEEIWNAVPNGAVIEIRP
jgi:murein L,D-transpeptidase YafK